MTDPLDRAAAALRDTSVPPAPSDLDAATLAALAAADLTLATRRRRMRLVRTIGATAALASAVTLAVVLGTGSPASALEAAVAKAKNAKSVRFVSTMVVHHPDFSPQVSTVSYQGSRMRVEHEAQVHIADFATSQALFLHPDWKYAFRAKGSQKYDPPLDYFNKFVNSRGVKEGADDVGGVKADRYRVVVERPADPRDYRMWIDPRTGWPVKVVGKGKVDMSGLDPKAPPADCTITDDRFEWDAPLDAKLFSLDVPPGYELGDGPRMAPPKRKD